MYKNKSILTGAACCLITILLCLAAGISADESLSKVRAVRQEDVPLKERIKNSTEISAALRGGLRRRAASLTITFTYGDDVLSQCEELVREWMEEALSETDRADEGDYIRYQYGGYTYNCSYSKEDTDYIYTIKIVPEYYSFLAWEETLDKMIPEITNGFSFVEGTADEEKIRAAYDYICSNVTYDKVHRKNPYYHKCSTAYAALTMHTATCQGYCTALYRLLREAGISCRIITGQAGEEELHSWLYVKLEDAWYLLDPTWDAGSETYRYYLKGSESTKEHIPGEDFRKEEFTRLYPLEEQDYGYNNGQRYE